jgi:hypothetical protein
MPPVQRVSANAISALKDALSAAFWFKRDLYNYAKAAVGGDAIFLSGIDWTDPNQYKRDSVNLFVDRLVKFQDEHRDLLIELMVDVAAMDDFPGLARVEDRDVKVAAAREAVARLRAVVAPHEQALMAQAAARERASTARAFAAQRQATSAHLATLKARFMEVTGMAPQQRGFALEPLLHDIFDTFDLQPRKSFRVIGEQIDGGFTLGGEHFLLEAKWQQGVVARDALDVFRAKVERRSENTLGLLVAVNGFEPTAVEMYTGAHAPIILMDGGDLFAVLEERIDLRELLERKRRESSMTGRVLITAAEILGATG